MNSNYKFVLIIISVIIAGVLLSGCESDKRESTIVAGSSFVTGYGTDELTASPTLVPAVAERVVPTVTQAPEPTAAPTATQIPKPTAAQTATQIPEPTVAQTATQTPEPTEVPIAETASDNAMNTNFFSAEISDGLFSFIKGKSFKDDCTVPREDLRYIHVLHMDIYGETHEGEMICNKYIAEDLVSIFEQLYEAGYPIERMKLVDYYDAEDEASMSDNNSSGFNFRFITGSTKVSKHGLGLAVDINTLYNPCVRKLKSGELVIEPASGEPYSDREKDYDYKIKQDDLCVSLFKAHGFEWGGDWNNPKDYQHFEIPSSVTESLYP